MTHHVTDHAIKPKLATDTRATQAGVSDGSDTEVLHDLRIDVQERPVRVQARSA